MSGPKTTLNGRRVVSISFDRPTLDKIAYWQNRLGITRSEAIRLIVKQTHLPSRFEAQTKEDITNES